MVIATICIGSYRETVLNLVEKTDRKCGEELHFRFSVMYSGKDITDTFIAQEKIYKGLGIGWCRSISSTLSADSTFCNDRGD